MHFALLALADTFQAAGPDLTRYLVVCGLLIGGLLALAWAFRRFLGRSLRTRAAKRSLQVLDVLPLSAKQKLVVVRCYDRSFLLGLGEKEVRAIAELDVEPDDTEPQAAVTGLPFASTLEERMVPFARPGRLEAREADATGPGSGPGSRTLGSQEGVLA